MNFFYHHKKSGFTHTPRFGVTPKGGGFTLIEIIVVVGIIGMVLSFAMLTDLNFLKGDIFRSEESTIVSLLEKARSRAMANMFNTTHGFCYIAPNYVLFKGSVCTTTDSELTPANENISSHSLTTFPTIIFSRLTGNTTDATIHIEDGIKTANIEINNEGTINW